MRAGTAEFCVLPSPGRGEKCAFSRELPFTVRGADNNLNMTLIPHCETGTQTRLRQQGHGSVSRRPRGRRKAPGGPRSTCLSSATTAAAWTHGQAAALLRVGPSGLPTAYPRAGWGSHQCGGCRKGDSQVRLSGSPEPSSEPRHVEDLDEDSRLTAAPRDHEPRSADTQVPDTCLGASRVVSPQPTPDL